MNIVKIQLIALSIMIMAYSVIHAEDLTKAKKDTNRINTTLAIYAGYLMGSGSTDFFASYKANFAGNKTSFDLSPEPGLHLRFELNENHRIGVNLSYYSSKISENTFQTVYSGEDILGGRNLSHDFHITTLPIMATYDWIPYTGQFRTYVGGAAGIAISSIKWDERLGTSIPNDNRTGGVHFDESQVIPALRIYTGTELLFDRNRYNKFKAGIVIEVAYTYIHRSANIFSKVSEQFIEMRQGINDNYFINSSYLSLNFAVIFEFTTLFIK